MQSMNIMKQQERENSLWDRFYKQQLRKYQLECGEVITRKMTDEEKRIYKCS